MLVGGNSHSLRNFEAETKLTARTGRCGRAARRGGLAGGGEVNFFPKRYMRKQMETRDAMTHKIQPT